LHPSIWQVQVYFNTFDQKNSIMAEDVQFVHYNDGHDDERQALANDGWSQIGPTTEGWYAGCDRWAKWSDFLNDYRYKYFCSTPDSGSSSTGGGSGSGSGSDSGSGSSSGSGGADYSKYTPVGYGPPPVSPPPAPAPPLGFYNPVTNTSFALNTPPAQASVFPNPLNTGSFTAPSPMLLQPGIGSISIGLPGIGSQGIASQGLSSPGLVSPGVSPQGLGYNPVTNRTPALSNPANPVDPSMGMRNFLSPGSGNQGSNTSSNRDSSSSSNSDSCYKILFVVSGDGPAYSGMLMFYKSDTNELAVSCGAISGCADPVHYGTPIGSSFTVTGYTGLGDSFRATLNPSSLTDPKTGNRVGPVYIFHASSSQTCTNGAIGIDATGSALKNIQDILKQCGKCKATLNVVPPQRSSSGDDSDTGTSSSGSDTTETQPEPIKKVYIAPISPIIPQPVFVQPQMPTLQLIPLPDNPVTQAANVVNTNATKNVANIPSAIAQTSTLNAGTPMDNFRPLEPAQDVLKPNHTQANLQDTFDRGVNNNQPPGAGPKIREAEFAIHHPKAALDIGDFERGSTNISTNAVRFVTRGNILNENSSAKGTQVNAARHALWQATITSKYGSNIAKQAGFAHEDNPNAINNKSQTDLKNMVFKSLVDADQAIDLANNIIGRQIGDANKGEGMRNLAQEVLNQFHDKGLWTVTKQSNGTYKMDLTKISEAQYIKLSYIYKKLDDNGYTLEELEKIIKEAKRKYDSGPKFL